MSEQQDMELIADLGEGMVLYRARLDSLREQDVNARILPLEQYGQMTSNIKKRGQLESVPYCALKDGRVEIVSGHHRIKAARSAGLTHAVVLVDESGLSRSEIVAKQLAHNKLSGFDDEQTLRLLFKQIDDPDLKLESGWAQDMLPEPPKLDWEGSLTPRMAMDWKTVTFAFLPHQMKHFEELLEALPASDLVGVACLEDFERFVAATKRYGRLKQVRSIGLMVGALTELALEEIAREELETDGSEA